MADISDATPLASACAAFVRDNPASVLAESVRIVATLLSNLAKEDNAKFRRVNLQNAKIKAAVVSAKGAVSVLQAAGFEEVEGGAALEHKASDASVKCAAALKALDDACATAEGTPFTLRLHLPHGGAGGVRCCSYAGDGSTLLTGAMDNIVRVFPSAPPLQGEAVPCAALVAHENARGASGVFALRALPGGEVASAGRDGKVCIWDATDAAGLGGAQPAPLAVLTGHGDARGKEVSS